MKEDLCRYLWNLEVKNGSVEMSMKIQDRTLGVMFDISDECSTVKDSAGYDLQFA